MQSSITPDILKTSFFPEVAYWDMEGDEKQGQSILPATKSKEKAFCMLLLQIMVHFIAIALVLFITWHAVPGSSLFSWHPTLMILGFGFFMFEAILIFSKSSSLIPSAARETKVKYHWILQVLGAFCAVGGFLAIFINKNQRNKMHFVSWHGFLGGIAVFMACFQACMGVSLLYPKLPVIKMLKLAVLKKLHALSGTLIFVLSCLVIFLAFYSNWFVKNVGLYSVAWGLCAVCPIFFGATVNNQVAQSYLYKKA